jgi:hypothetical protein
MIRFTLDESTMRIAVHSGMGERDLQPDEAEKIRNALESPRLPWWLEYGSIAAVLVAAVVMLRGGGQ